MIKSIEASCRYSTLYKKKHRCNEERLLKVLYGSYAYISRHTTLVASLFGEIQGLYDCRGGGAQINENNGESDSNSSEVQFTATEQDINHYAANVLSNSATLNSKYGRESKVLKYVLTMQQLQRPKAY